MTFPTTYYGNYVKVTHLLTILRAEGGGLEDHHGVCATQQYGGRGHLAGFVSDLRDISILQIDPLLLCLTLLYHTYSILKIEHTQHVTAS